MTVYAFYLYNRSGQCLLYRRWHQAPKGKRGVEHETRLMWGLLFSMKELVHKMTPRQIDETEPTPLLSFTTHDSKVHYMETLTGLRLILTTDASQSSSAPPAAPPPASAPPTPSASASASAAAAAAQSSRSVLDALLQIYRFWVELCLKNPLYRSSDDGEGAATASSSLVLVECVRGAGGAVVDGAAGGEGVQLLDTECPQLVERIVQFIEQLPYFH